MFNGSLQDIKTGIFSDILEFHLNVIDKGYIAIDFYDGSIMYDFNRNKTMICDIDYYMKQPVINTMGRMWGSSRFMSPEEFWQGSAIDEISNVYVMGATVFALMGGETDRVFDKWKGSEKQSRVAVKAVSKERDDRYESLTRFADSWYNACE